MSNVYFESSSPGRLPKWQRVAMQLKESKSALYRNSEECNSKIKVNLFIYSRLFTSFGGLFRQLLIEEFGRSSCGRLHLSGLMLVPLSPDSGDVSCSNLMDLVEHDPQKGDYSGPGVKNYF